MAERNYFFNLRRVDQTHSKIFNTKCTRYLVDIADIPPQANIPDAVNTLPQILHDITDEILHGVPDNDMIRLVITSDRDLDTPKKKKMAPNQKENGSWRVASISHCIMLQCHKDVLMNFI